MHLSCSICTQEFQAGGHEVVFQNNNFSDTEIEFVHKLLTACCLANNDFEKNKKFWNSSCLEIYILIIENYEKLSFISSPVVRW